MAQLAYLALVEVAAERQVGQHRWEIPPAWEAAAVVHSMEKLQALAEAAERTEHLIQALEEVVEPLAKSPWPATMV